MWVVATVCLVVGGIFGAVLGVLFWNNRRKAELENHSVLDSTYHDFIKSNEYDKQVEAFTEFDQEHIVEFVDTSNRYNRKDEKNITAFALANDVVKEKSKNTDTAWSKLIIKNER